MSTDPVKNYEIGLLFDLYGALLTERQREVTDLYYNDDLSLSEVAEECGITRQGVRDALLKAEEQLRHCEEALHLLERQRANEALRDEIRALLLKGAQGEKISALVEKLSL